VVKRHGDVAHRGLQIVDVVLGAVGGPDTVADQLVEMAREFGIGHLFAMLQIGSMGRELTIKNITLFAELVLPRLHDIWADDDHANHWWPERLGGTPLSDEAAARPLARI
jgi:hypothetical protein